MNASREALYSALRDDRVVADALLAARDLTTVGWRECLVGEEVKVTDSRVSGYLFSQLQNPREERLHAIFLDENNRFIRDERVGLGTRNSLSLRMRSIVHRSLELEANKILIAHNHPSGCALPSEEDRRATAEFERTIRALDIELVDHCIVARSGIYSMRLSKML